MATIFIGSLLCLLLWTLGSILGSPIVIGYFASFAFGSTAIASWGGSTVPLFIAPAMVLLASIAMKPQFATDVVAILRSQPLAQLTCAIAVLGVASSILLPRLFAGSVNVVVPVDGLTIEAPLGPVPSNFNQAAYFVLHVPMFLATALLLRQGRQAEIRLGFLAWASIHAALGAIDILCKMSGLGDVLQPIRTAGYTMLTETEAVGFWRIVGGFPEASAYATGALQAFAFILVDWENTRSRLCLLLALLYLVLIIFSTSSTAYVGMIAVGAAYSIYLILPLIRGRVYPQHIAVLVFVWMAAMLALIAYLYDEQIFDPLIQLILESTIYKSSTESAMVRGFWNEQSIKAFYDTFGMGVGLGSTRSSSWPISVLAQLGVAGAVGFTIMIGAFIFGLFLSRRHVSGSLAASASACTLAGVVAASFGGGGADPGPIFFISLAVLSAALSGASRPSRKGGAREFRPPRHRSQRAGNLGIGRRSS